MIKWFKNIFRNVKSIIGWIPVLWNNYDYDAMCLLYIIRYKLKRVREHIGDHNIIERADEVQAQMQICEDAITRILDEEYTDKEEDDLDLKWKEFSREELNNNPELLKQKADEWLEIMTKSYKLKEADMDLLFKTIRENIRDWWD